MFLESCNCYNTGEPTWEKLTYYELAEMCESNLIPRAERYFGPRDSNWKLGGIRRNPSGDFPQIQLFPDSGYVDIYLSSQLDKGNLPAIMYEGSISFPPTCSIKVGGVHSIVTNTRKFHARI